MIDESIVGSAIAVGRDHGVDSQTFGFNAFSSELERGEHTVKVLWHTFPEGETSCVEARIGIEVLLEQLPELHLAPAQPITYLPGLINRALQHVHVTWAASRQAD